MLDINAIFWLTLLALVVFYWMHSLRAKEQAFNAAHRHCEQMQVQFLDQSVYLKRIGFKRNEQGQLSLWRNFYFEFTVNGDDRYFGRVLMLGKKIMAVQLDPHRLH
ncbi:MAG TPA: DUF3301 domain-containing protein [Cellvibrio sp.]|nr:DUF3301 domain-containing protein [Cellvibrio sp.]